MSGPPFAIIDAPSILGLRPAGAERLPEALRGAGLLEALDADYAGGVETLPYDPKRDPSTHMLNPGGIRAFSLRLAEAVSGVLGERRFPVVLGGDCSVLIGCLLALRRTGSRYGLFFADGHADFYQPEASSTGEVAEMELGIVTGRGPDLLTDIDGLRPLVRDEDVVVFGFRHAERAAAQGSRDVRETSIYVFDLAQVRSPEFTTAARAAVGNLLRDELSGFWIHLDADVLDDEIMPAVDYRMEGGLSFSELSELLKVLLASGGAVGMTITIFNPALDADGSIARAFVSSVAAGLS
jgi:arginase